MGSAAAPGPGRPAPKRQSLCGSTVQQRSHAVEVRQGYGMLVIKAGRNSFWNVHKSGSLALAIDPIQNRLWDKGRIYLGEKTSQDFVMPDALPSPERSENQQCSHVLPRQKRYTVTLKSSNQKDVCCSKHLQTVQQRSKFPSPKNLLSLKYPKRGMSL
ncbi:unnamed protein product [Sphagnum troendelagicum]|uniref:Uncharacterized protein n=1 Tax=Sphagnum troendelagicum TaxID=128251 RepID=A0ABP0ULB1_9BRYO